MVAHISRRPLLVPRIDVVPRVHVDTLWSLLWTSMLVYHPYQLRLPACNRTARYAHVPSTACMTTLSISSFFYRQIHCIFFHCVPVTKHDALGHMAVLPFAFAAVDKANLRMGHVVQGAGCRKERPCGSRCVLLGKREGEKESF